MIAIVLYGVTSVLAAFRQTTIACRFGGCTSEIFWSKPIGCRCTDHDSGVGMLRLRLFDHCEYHLPLSVLVDFDIGTTTTLVAEALPARGSLIVRLVWCDLERQGGERGW